MNYRLLITLEDGRNLYLSSNGQVLTMPPREAEFWQHVANSVRGCTIDEMVYSQDLKSYEHRSYYVERLLPFVWTVKTTIDSLARPINPTAFIIGGQLAKDVGVTFRSNYDYSNAVLVIA